jgi:hypothetical protein
LKVFDGHVSVDWDLAAQAEFAENAILFENP